MEGAAHAPMVNWELPALDSPPRQLPREILADVHNQRNTLPSTPSRQMVHSHRNTLPVSPSNTLPGLQFGGSPWRTGPATPLNAPTWRTIAPELTPDNPSGGGHSQGTPRIHITVPERLGRDRTVRFDHGGTTYSVTIPPDYSPGSRVEVELTAPLSRPLPPPIGLDN